MLFALGLGGLLLLGLGGLLLPLAASREGGGGCLRCMGFVLDDRGGSVRVLLLGVGSVPMIPWLEVADTYHPIGPPPSC